MPERDAASVARETWHLLSEQSDWQETNQNKFRWIWYILQSENLSWKVSDRWKKYKNTFKGSRLKTSCSVVSGWITRNRAFKVIYFFTCMQCNDYHATGYGNKPLRLWVNPFFVGHAPTERLLFFIIGTYVKDLNPLSTEQNNITAQQTALSPSISASLRLNSRFKERRRQYFHEYSQTGMKT